MRRPLFALLEAVRLDRDLRLILLSNFFWSAGFMLYSFLWPIYVRDLRGSAREIGLLSSLMALTMTVTLVPGGFLAERWNRKHLILLTWVIATPAPLVYALARSWEQLIPGVVLYSFFLGWPAYEGYIAAASAPERLSRAYALTSAGFSLGAIIAPLAGAALLPHIGLRRIFLISFALFCASTVTLFLLSPQEVAKRDREGEVGNGFSGLARDRRLIVWLLILALAALGASTARPFVPPLLEDRFGLARPAILMTSAILALGEVGLAVLLGWVADHWRRGRALGLALVSLAFSYIFLFSSFGPYVIPLAMLLLGGDRVSISLSRSIVGHRARGRGQGAGPAFTVYWLVLGLAQTGGPYLGGILYRQAALWPFYVGAGLAALAAGALWRFGELGANQRSK